MKIIIFSHSRIHSTKAVIDRVVQLFRGQPALIFHFDYFLPDGCELYFNGDGKPTAVIPGREIITVCCYFTVNIQQNWDCIISIYFISCNYGNLVKLKSFKYAHEEHSSAYRSYANEFLLTDWKKVKEDKLISFLQQK